MATKTTKKDYFNMLLEINEVTSNEDLVNFINHELELLDKKNKTKSTELTETQKENLALGNEILEYMKDHKDITIAQIRKVWGLSSQKVTPIMNKLENENKIVRNIEKRVSYFNLV